MFFIDTHSHIYLEQFNDDRQDVVSNAIKEGVTKIFLPNIDSSTTSDMLQLCDDYPNNCFPMMGLHPCSVKENYLDEIAHIEEELAKRKFYAIGEIGIDLYWEKSFLKEQQTAFRLQCALAKKHNLPIVIHVRDAFDEIFELMDELNDEKLYGIFHCFSGNTEQAKQIIDYGGFMLGIGGVVTFKNAKLDEALADIPLEYLVVETDAPYLTPVPFRGKRNEPAYIPYIAGKLAEIYGVTKEQVALQTTANAEKVFKS